MMGIAVILAAVPAACSGGSPSSSSKSAGSFSVAASLRQLPAVLRDVTADGYVAGFQVAMSDLDAASALAGAERPPVGSTDATLLGAWLTKIRGDRRKDHRPIVSALLPAAAPLKGVKSIDQLVDEIGWSLGDVHSFVEYRAPPQLFTAMSGTFDADTLTQAAGQPTNDIWRLGGDDLSTDPDDRSATRPAGEALRFAVNDDALAVARSTPPIEAWLAGPDASTGTLADDEALIGVAEALDRSHVYTATLVESTAIGGGLRPPTSAGQPAIGPGKFTALGVGLSVDAGMPIATFAYYYADDSAAAAAVQPMTALVTEGKYVANDLPWSRFLTVRDISASGPVLTARFELTDTMSADQVWLILLIGESLVSNT